MKRWHVALAVAGALILAACGGGTGPTATPEGGVGVAVEATSDVPTPETQMGGALQAGSLVVTQLGQPLAVLPDRTVLNLPVDRFGQQGSPNGRYGVAFTPGSGGIVLTLMDYSATPPASKPVPGAEGLRGPGVTWKPDSSGFAFFDFPPMGQRPALRSIQYYDVASGETRPLIPDVDDANEIPISVSFSPDGAYLLYVVGDANAEGIGGPGSSPFLLSLSAGQVNSLEPDTLFGPVQWLLDSSGFLVLRPDAETGTNAVYRYDLNALTSPRRLTPDGISDLMADLSADGAWVAVSSTGDTPNGVANVFIMEVDGSNRRQLTRFADPDQSITALLWESDGIYYSLTAADNTSTTWRMDLDGQNPGQIAEGTLYSITR
jgi:Tol biopolymer transport system component